MIGKQLGQLVIRQFVDRLGQEVNLFNFVRVFIC